MRDKVVPLCFDRVGCIMLGIEIIVEGECEPINAADSEEQIKSLGCKSVVDIERRGGGNQRDAPSINVGEKKLA